MPIRRKETLWEATRGPDVLPLLPHRKLNVSVMKTRTRPPLRHHDVSGSHGRESTSGRPDTKVNRTQRVPGNHLSADLQTAWKVWSLEGHPGVRVQRAGPRDLWQTVLCVPALSVVGNSGSNLLLISTRERESTPGVFICCCTEHAGLNLFSQRQLQGCGWNGVSMRLCQSDTKPG